MQKPDCELLDKTLKKGPQVVTRYGVEVAVLVPIAEWRCLKQVSRPSLKEILLGPGPRFENLVPPRRRLRMRRSQVLNEVLSARRERCFRVRSGWARLRKNVTSPHVRLQAALKVWKELIDINRRVTAEGFYVGFSLRTIHVHKKSGRAGWDRTSNPQLRRLMLYPIELRPHIDARGPGAAAHVHYRKSELQLSTLRRKPFTPTQLNTTRLMVNAMIVTQAGMCGSDGVSVVRKPSLI